MPIRQLSWKVHHIRENRPSRSRSLRTKIKTFWLPFFGILIVLGIMTIVGVFAWFSRDLPDPNKVLSRTVAQSTQIYDRTGTILLYDIHGEENRTVIELKDIPDSVKWATIAIEDKDFYKHKGFSLWAIGRTLVTNILLNRKAGGSTITQQFIKNAILTSEKTYTRKIKEIVLAYQMERKFSKDQILKLYLNEIPYGSSYYGVESAAQGYFGKSAKDLTLAESALLAALPQAPTYYSPWGNHTDELFGRQRYILGLMAEQGYITKDAAEKAKQEKLTFKFKGESIKAPHFVMYVKELLTDTYGEKMVEQGGLKVYTTLDMYKQGIAEDVVKKGAERNDKYGASNAALVAMDPKNGDILAMVGSRDYFDIQHEGNVNVAIRERQPGSSFKPVVYATAFIKGFTPETMLFDLTTNFDTGSGKTYTPRNYDGTEHGPLTMRKALAGSLNIPAVKTLYLAGIDNVLDLAHAMGYTTLNQPERYGLSLVLGGGEVKLLDHVSAYSVFAREGLRHPARAILKVEDNKGKILEQTGDQETRVLDENIAREINSILSDNSARAFIFGTHNYLTLSDRPVAAKTGTTSDYRDGWTIGYTPSLVAGVWVGNNNNDKMKAGADGVVVAAPIWHDFMEQVLGDTPKETFKAPAPNKTTKPVLNGQIDEVVVKKVDKITQRVIPDSCLDTYPAKYVMDKKFKITHTILYYVDKNNPGGPAPTNPNADPQFANWEAPVLQWAKKQGGYLTGDFVYEDCNLRSNLQNEPQIKLTSPQSDAEIVDQSFTITAETTSPVPVTKVEFYIDDTLVQTLPQEPYSFTYTVTDLANGTHALRARVINQNNLFGEDKVNFILTLANRVAKLTFITPTENSTITTEQFPDTITVLAFDPEGVVRVELFYQKTSSATAQSLGAVDNPTQDTVDFTWATAPESNQYRLYFKVTNKKGQVHQSNYLDLTIH